MIFLPEILKLIQSKNISQTAITELSWLIKQEVTINIDYNKVNWAQLIIIQDLFAELSYIINKAEFA